MTRTVVEFCDTCFRPFDAPERHGPGRRAWMCGECKREAHRKRNKRCNARKKARREVMPLPSSTGSRNLD